MLDTNLEMKELMREKLSVPVLESAGSAATIQLGSLYVPFGTPSSATEATFSGFGISSAGETPRTGWVISAPDGTEATKFVTYCAGSIRYDKTATPSRIVLTNLDVMAELVRAADLPDWFPRVRYVLYANVDEAETRSIILDYLNAEPSRVSVLNAKLGSGSTLTAADFADAFLNGDTAKLPKGIEVKAGTVIGMSKLSGSTRQGTISMQQDLNNPDNLYLDPAVYHDHFSGYFSNLSGHPLQAQLQRPFAGPIANGVIRYVQSGSTATGDFTSAAAPAGSIPDAISIANPYDTIVIIDGSSYYTDTYIQIRKPLSITSLSAETVVTANATSGQLEAVAPTAFPKLDGKTSRGVQNDKSVIWVDSVEGIVSICNVEMLNGNSEAMGTGMMAGGLHGGGGILIKDANQTYIRNCYIHDNVTQSGSGLAGFGGGIYAYYSSAYIYKNLISENRAGARGGGIGVGGYGWPTIDSNIITGNRSASSNRGDGGGIGIEICFLDDSTVSDNAEAILEYFHLTDSWSDSTVEDATGHRVKIFSNRIDSNYAEDDGGGIYASVQSYVLTENNSIFSNTAHNSGGGVRITYGSDVRMDGDHIYENIAEANDPTIGGGGVSIQCAKVILRDVKIEDNIVNNAMGGGLYVHSDHNSDSKYKTVLEDIFDFHTCEVEVTGYESLIQGNIAAMNENGEDQRMGGGICIKRENEPTNGSIALNVYVERYLDVVADNGNDTVITAAGTRIFETSSEFRNSENIHVEDLVHRPADPAIDDSNVGVWIADSTFRYESA